MENTFNKYDFLREIKNSLISEEYVIDEETAHEEINRLIENEVIYYADCFDICKELNATDFYLDEMGEHAKDITELAYYALLEVVNKEIDIQEILKEKFNKEETEVKSE